MMRNTLPLLSILVLASALVAGCDDPPAEGGKATSPAPEGSARPRGRGRVSRIRAANGAHRPSFLREALDDAGAADSGAVIDGGDAVDGAAPAAIRTWSFDKDKPGAAPADFELAAGSGKPGQWSIKAEPSGGSGPNVLAQLDGSGAAARFLTAVAKEPSVRDARVAVRCKLVSGKADQSCGLVVRFKDAKSYYVARADAVAKDVNLGVVTDGKLRVIGGAKSAAFPDGWHELRVEARGDHFEVSWDGARVYTADDKSLPDAGRVGVWTQGDAVTYFDDLSVTPL
jgi:hypothetical protein